ncbi:MAG: hypothetical protein CMM60_13275 [Rhodospirillaceae bacterium]|jgi:L-lactate dehydrogenase complex protein LldG|nr:hypothetical protein [Rhodospirillaceae bacterium]|tara:strand:- start:1167 stop:1832 length:666 start_codon:yes stop_codon:yes gene_type:complete
MSDVREHVLADVRAALGGGQPDPAVVAREAAAILANPACVQPKFDDLSNLERFVERAISETLTATVDRVQDFAAVPGAVRQYLSEHGLALDISMVNVEQLAEQDWGDVSYHHTIDPEELVSVGLADYGIAETGTLVFQSCPEAPTLFNYLPLHHIVVIEAKKVLRYIEDYWVEVRAAGNIHPRNINFITGTSGTADIEAKNIRGAHGPRFLHIVIIHDAGE